MVVKRLPREIPERGSHCESLVIVFANDCPTVEKAQIDETKEVSERFSARGKISSLDNIQAPIPNCVIAAIGKMDEKALGRSALMTGGVLYASVKSSLSVMSIIAIDRNKIGISSGIPVLQVKQTNMVVKI